MVLRVIGGAVDQAQDLDDSAHPRQVARGGLQRTQQVDGDGACRSPAFVGGHSGTDEIGAYDVYMLYNRNFLRSNNLAPGEFGGQATEIRVYAPGSLPTQTVPNT